TRHQAPTHIETHPRSLHDALPIEDVTKYPVTSGQITGEIGGDQCNLRNPEVYAGYAGEESSPSGILFRNNGLYFEIQIDPESPIGKTDKAGVKNILMESAITTIMDFEDSVAAVDATDKT